MYQEFAPDSSKMNSTDRIFTLAPMEGKPTSSTGLVDKRLFTGENKLHAIQDPENCMWTLRYDHGLVPEPLRQKFTSMRLLKEFVTGYFNRRNIEVKELNA